VAAGLNKALQVCNGSMYETDRSVVGVHTLKIEALEELVREIEGGVVLFYQFRHDMDGIQHALGGEVRFIEQAGALEDWNAGKFQVLAAHPASMATGLNLQSRGNTIIWFGLTWDLWFYLQGNARVRRLGNAHPSVVVHRILTNHPVERRQVAVVEGKAALADAIQRLKGDL